MGREIFVAIAYIIVGIVMIVSCSILIYIKRNKLLKWPITSYCCRYYKKEGIQDGSYSVIQLLLNLP